MTLTPARDKTQCADRQWVAIDTDRTAEGPYTVNGHPMVELPFVNEALGCTHMRMFWRRRRDVQVAIDSLRMENQKCG